MRVLFLNNDGGGFADYVEVSEGTTVSAFFAKQMPSRSPNDYLIRVNRQPAAADQGLCEGDRISATPVKIEGAAVRKIPVSRATTRKPTAGHRQRRKR